MMLCVICNQELRGHQWGIIPVNVMDSGWIDVEGEVSFAVHPYCMDEAVEWYTGELADGFIENIYIKEAKDD